MSQTIDSSVTKAIRSISAMARLLHMHEGEWVHPDDAATIMNVLDRALNQLKAME